MIVQIQDITCCELHDSQLPDVVQLLGKDSFTFRLDQAQNHLNLVLPVNEYQVILEANDDRLAILLVYLMSKLKQAQFPTVFTVHTEADRQRMIQRVNINYPVLWMTFDQESNSQEWLIHYSLQSKKTSKQLAERIMTYLSREVSARLRSEPITWTHIANSLRTQSEKPIPKIRVSLPDVEAYPTDYMEEIAERLAKAVVSVYTDKPLLELMQGLVVLEEKAKELLIPIVTEVPMMSEILETAESSKRVEETEGIKLIDQVEQQDTIERIEYQEEEATNRLQQELETKLVPEPTSVPASVLENTSELVICSDQEERMNVNIQESSVARVQQRMSQSTSVLCMLRAHAQRTEPSEQAMRPSSSSSFMAHMTQLSVSNNKEGKQQRPFNILLHQHNRNKSVHEK